jgi:hypothetical protein
MHFNIAVPSLPNKKKATETTASIARRLLFNNEFYAAA